MKKSNIYFLPFLLSLLVFRIYPFLRIILISLMENYEFFTESYSSIGIENYVLAISDPKFLSALSNTVIYSVFSGIIALVISLFLANHLMNNSKVDRIFQTAFFMPLVTSTVAIGLVWRFMFNESFGIVNHILDLAGAGKVLWFSDKHLQMLILTSLGTWELIPITLLLLLCALQGIDPKILKLASLDTDSQMRIFWRVKLPLIKNTVIAVTILNFIDSIKVFDSLFLLFNGRAGTTNNLYTLVYYVYYKMFDRSDYGAAAAAATIIVIFLAVIIIVLSIIKKGLSVGYEEKP